jgi:hypothetical protein
MTKGIGITFLEPSPTPAYRQTGSLSRQSGGQEKKGGKTFLGRIETRGRNASALIKGDIYF